MNLQTDLILTGSSNLPESAKRLNEAYLAAMARSYEESKTKTASSLGN